MFRRLECSIGGGLRLQVVFFLAFSSGSGSAFAEAGWEDYQKRIPEVLYSCEVSDLPVLEFPVLPEEIRFLNSSPSARDEQILGLSVAQGLIQTSNLDFFVADEDFQGESSRLFPFERVYNRYIRPDGGQSELGEHWRFGFDSQLKEVPGGVLLSLPYGKPVLFVEEPAGSSEGGRPEEVRWTSVGNNGKFGTIVRTRLGWLRIDPLTGATYRYESSVHQGIFRITKIQDRFRHTLLLRYDAEGRLISIEVPEMRWQAQLVYGDDGNCSGLLSSSGEEISYSYDDQGNLVAVNDSKGNETRYAYDDSVDMVGIFEPGREVRIAYTWSEEGEKRISRWTERSGEVLFFRETDSLTGEMSVTIWRRNDEWTRFRSLEGRTVGVETGSGKRFSFEYVEGELVSRTDEGGATTWYEWDQSGRLTRWSDSSGRQSEFVYDVLGTLIRSRDREGNLWTFDYNDQGHVIRAVGSNGEEVRLEYAPSGELIELTRATHSFGAAPLGPESELAWDSALVSDPGFPMAVNKTIDVVYQGLDNVHLEYHWSATGVNDIGIKLVVLDPSGGETVWKDAEGNPPLTLSGKGRYPDSGDSLTPNSTYRFVFRVVSKEPGKQPVETEVYSKSVTLNNTVKGKLLADETIDGSSAGISPVQNSGVEVPDTTRLTIQNSKVAGTLTVKGTLDLASSADVRGMSVLLYSAHTFNDLNGVRIFFKLGSGGSEVTGGKDLDLSFGTDFGVSESVKVNDVESLLLDIKNLYGAVTVKKVKALLVDTWGGNLMAPAGDAARATFEEVTFKQPTGSPYSKVDIWWYPKGEILIKKCLFEKTVNLGLYGRNPYKITISDSVFRGSNLFINGGSPVILRNEFAAGIRLGNRCKAQISENAFTSPILFQNYAGEGEAWNKTGDNPTIENNSFWGREALKYEDYNTSNEGPPSPIPIGSNYYGDFSGARRTECTFGDDPNEPDFLTGDRGALVTIRNCRKQEIFSGIDQHMTSGYKEFTDSEILAAEPDIWLAGWVLGQHTIPHAKHGQGAPLTLGKETLVSLNVVASRNNTSCSFEAVFGGTTVAPTRSSYTLHREIRNYGRSAIENALTTVNFVLPSSASSLVSLEVYKIRNGRRTSILRTSPWFQSPPVSRAMRIVVVPVSLPPDQPAPVARRAQLWIQQFLPAVFPLRSSDVRVWGHAELPYLAGGPMRTSVAVWNVISGLMLGLKYSYDSTHSPHIDFFVGFLPAGALGTGIDAAHFGGYRNQIILVDEQKLDAVPHELMHALGHWTSPEQYAQYPDFGLPNLHVTAFDSADGSAGLSTFDGGDNGRISHRGGPGQLWYNAGSQTENWADLMGSTGLSGGAPIKKLWPTLDTINRFRGSIGSAVRSAVRSGGSVEPVVFAAPAPGYRRIWLTSSTERFRQNGNLGYKLKEGNVRAMDITSISLGSITPDTSGQGDLYKLEAFDSKGAVVQTDQFSIPKPDTPIPPSEGFWVATFDVPDGAIRIRLTRLADNRVYLDIRSSTSPTTKILTPASNAKNLAGVINFSWQDSGFNGSGQPVQHLLVFSEDGGATWSPQMQKIEGTGIQLSSAFLPSGVNLSVRLLSSDGLRTVESRVDGLQIANQAPTVDIVTPRDNEKAEPGTSWAFRADAFDNDEGFLKNGKWTSSIAGELGQGNQLTGVVLGPGKHTIRYEVEDSSHQKGSDQISVEVGQMNSVDLGLSVGDLYVQPVGSDPTSTGNSELKQSGSNLAALSIRNTGRTTSVTAKLYVTAPGTSEVLLSTQAFTLEPFEVGTLETLFVPIMSGNHTFRAVLSGFSPADSNAANNQRSWVYPTASVPKKLWIPLLQGDDTTYTGIAVSNYSGTDALLNFEAIGPNGAALALPGNPSSQYLFADNQLARLGTEIFQVNSATLPTGWIEMTSDNPEAGGFFMIGSSDYKRLDGSVAVGGLSKKFYFSRVHQGSASFKGRFGRTYLSIANPTSNPIKVRLRLKQDSGTSIEKTVNIASRGMLYNSVSSIFSTSASISEAYVSAEVIQGLGAVGFELIEFDTEKTLLGLNAMTAGTETKLYSAQLAKVPGFFTNIRIVNTSTASRKVTLTAINDSGAVAGAPVQLTLKAGGAVEGEAEEFFSWGSGQNFVGTLHVEADGPGILGDVVFGEPGSLKYLASLPLQTKTFTTAVFSQVANGYGYYTGLAVHNPGTQSAKVSVEVYSPDGVKTATANPELTLAPGTRKSQLIPEIAPASLGQVGGFIVVKSNVPLVAQLLFGGADMLSSVPPAVSQ